MGFSPPQKGYFRGNIEKEDAQKPFLVYVFHGKAFAWDAVHQKFTRTLEAVPSVSDGGKIVGQFSEQEV